jgi:anti-anti-sigma factor
MIAEPDDVFFDVLRYNLIKRLYEIDRVVTGTDLIEKALAVTPDLMILNYNLGDLDALSAAEILRGRQIVKKPIPTIFVSAVVDKELIRRAAALESTSFLSVPYDLDDVIERIENHLGVERIIETIQLRGAVVLELKGGIAHYHAKTLKSALATLFGSEHKRIVVDLSETDFLAHQLLVIFLSAREKMKHLGGKIVFSGPNDGIQTLFRRASIHRVFEIHADRASALKSVTAF